MKSQKESPEFVAIQKRRKDMRGPESRYFDKAKGKIIRIFWKHDPDRSDMGRLLWVDRYTIGFRSGERYERLIYKDGIESIEIVDTKKRDEPHGPSETTAEGLQ